jgi:UV DNA damage endonuclease
MVETSRFIRGINPKSQIYNRMTKIQLPEINESEQTITNLITAMPDVYYQAPWIDLEAKHKEKAITHLLDWWLI